MKTATLQRLAIGLVLAGSLMTVLALVAGDRSLRPSWSAAHSVLGGFATVWLWAASPRLREEEIACE